MGKKYTDNEIIRYTIYVSKMVFIGEQVNHETFRQIKINDEYAPYLISSFGRVFSMFYGNSSNMNIRELKTNMNGSNYKKISIDYKNKSYNFAIHRLVALYFIDNPLNKPEVNHINGVKTDNYTWNLEWVTSHENHIHAEKLHLMNHHHGERIDSTMTEDMVIHICNMIMKDIPPKVIIAENGINRSNFQGILKYRRWKHITQYYDFSNYSYQVKVS